MNSNIRQINSSNDISGINAPIAESTLLEDKRQSIARSSSKGIFKRRTISPISNASKQLSRTNLNSPAAKIDPHVITDAQSNGLVSRIVKYYENSQQDLEKTKSAYNKFGQFPIVHLKKNEIKFSPKNNLVRSSSVRIAPPDKGIFNRNYRSAILRSNSLMSMPGAVPKLVPTMMKKNEVNKIITSNNEPLSPITGEEHHYPIQSKSVLDALKEISRKRINNEEINLDRTKKYCYTQDMTDSPSMGETLSAKRPREQVSPNRKTLKKIKMKNNDILSSLSSSQFLNRKPEIFEDVVPSSILQPRKEQELTQKSSLPPAPPAQIQILQQKETEAVKISPPLVAKQSTRKLTLFNQHSNIPELPKKLSADEENDEEEEDEFRVNFIKPKNQKISVDTMISLNSVEKSKLSLMLSCLGGDLDEPDSSKSKEQDKIDGKIPEVSETSTAANISFATTTITTNVAPISTSSLSTITSLSSVPVVNSSEISAITKTVESDQAPNLEKPKEIKVPTFSFGTNSSSTAVSSSISISSSSAPTFSAPNISTAITDAQEPQSNPLKLLEDASKSNTSLLGLFGNSNSSTSTTVDPNKSLMSFTTPAKPTEEPKIGISFPKPSIGGFNIAPASNSINLPTTSNSQVTTTSSNFMFGSNTSAPVPTFSGFTPSIVSSTATTSSNSISILGSAPANSTTAVFGNNTNSTGMFGSTTVPSGLLPKSDAKSELPGNSNMSFLTGGSVGILGNRPTTTSSILGTSSAPSFTFGETKPAPAVNFESKSNVASAPKPAFSFGSNPEPPKSENPNPSFKSSSMVAPESTFGSSTLFNQNSGSVFGNSQAPGGFSFGSTQANSQQTVTTTATGVGFSFQAQPVSTNSGGFSFQSPSAGGAPFNLGGQSNQSQPPTTTQSGFNFSQPKPSETVKPSFSFGGSQQPAVPTQQTSSASSNMFAFGSNNSQQNNNNSSSFTFKAPSSQTAPTNNVFGSSNAIGTGNDVSATFNLKLPAQTQGIFGQSQPQTQNSSASIFGQATQPQNSAAPPPYQFGGAATNQDSSQNKPFAFGGANATTNSSANPTNIFGSNPAQQQQKQANTNGMFNFSSSVPAPAPMNPFGAQPQSNLFNMGASSTQQRRPMRQATRRLK